MFKAIAITAALLVTLAGASYALNNPDFIENVPGINFKTSNNVKVAYTFDTVGTTAQNYAVVAKHTSGDTYYAGSNISTNIMKWKVPDDTGKALDLADTTHVTAVVAGDSIFTGYSPL